MNNESNASPKLLIMVAGAKGAVASTLAAAVTMLQNDPLTILPGLTTADKFPFLGPCHSIAMAGWDSASIDLTEAITHHQVLPPSMWLPCKPALAQIPLRPAPATTLPLAEQVQQIKQDIEQFNRHHPGAKPVLINLLPAAGDLPDPDRFDYLEALLADPAAAALPDLAYVLAAIDAGVSVVNFSPNTVELPLICRLARENKVVLAGRDGKSGQTYFKVVLASALKARGLYVDGWYSLNILGNADGRNLMDPDHACGKLNNKTNLLDDILEYSVGERYGESAHTVRIDYYAPRGDAKEAWDVIDIKGIFGMPMSLRVNLQGRDSILAAPMALDLARWSAALQTAGFAGPIAELGFYFKKPVGQHAPLTFQAQLTALQQLERSIIERMG